MNLENTLVTVNEVIGVIEKLQILVSNANAAGQTHVPLSPLQAAFSALDLAEAELDKAIAEAKS